MNWQKIFVRFDWLGHIIEAVIMAAVVALLFFGLGVRISVPVAILIGGAFAVGHFHGREKRDYEVSVRMTPPHLKGYLIWRWSKDQLTDFLPVVVVFLVVFGCMVVFG